MTQRQKAILFSTTFGLILTGLCVPGILEFFQAVYISGELKTGSPCTGGLAFLLSGPMKVISLLSVVLMYSLDAIAIAATYALTQLPLAIYLRSSRRG